MRAGTFCVQKSVCLRCEAGFDWLIGVGIGFRRPRPPNRTGGFPAYGSPVGGFFIETVSQFARLHEVRTARQLRSKHLAIVDDRSVLSRSRTVAFAFATSPAGAGGSSCRAR